WSRRPSGARPTATGRPPSRRSARTPAVRGSARPPGRRPSRRLRAMRARRIGAWVLLALAAVATVVALLAGYARMTVLDGDQFAERTVAALRKPAVRDAVAREITAQAINADRDLVAIRPLVES